MQSPMQFRAIQVRLALCTSDMVTVYPSPTHTRIRTRASRKHGRRESHGRERWYIRAASVGRAAAVDAALAFRSYERSRMARPRRRPSPSSLKRATSPRVTDDPSTSRLQDQERPPRASHVRQVIKRRTIPHLKATEDYATFWWNLPLSVWKEGEEINRDPLLIESENREIRLGSLLQLI